ncbi:glutaredoxin family protein [Aestuariimicrobium soli]|uniref:glutaredoxin family protein n=1 Tax=Aestuariimicrobium soli TaxID=2035834 RepID=UPI003EBA8A52
MSWWRRLLGASTSHPKTPAPSEDPHGTCDLSAGLGVPETDPVPSPEYSEHSETPALPAFVRDVTAAHRVVLLTREGCHLCDDAETVVQQVVAGRGLTHARVMIDDDPATRERFTTDIPVVIVDGRVIARWRVTTDDVTTALDQQCPTAAVKEQQ